MAVGRGLDQDPEPQAGQGPEGLGQKTGMSELGVCQGPMDEPRCQCKAVLSTGCPG